MQSDVFKRKLYVRFSEAREVTSENKLPEQGLKQGDINVPQFVAQCGEVRKKGWSKEDSYWIQYAYNISDCDKGFIAKMLAENGEVTHDRRSDIIGKNGYYDYGFCQINRGYHKDIVDDPRFLADKEWQIKACYNLWKNGTTFYAPLTNGYRQLEFL